MAQQRAVERQMSNLLIELTEMARTVSASLDTRSAKLEALLDEADKRIETLRAMNASSAPIAPSNPAPLASRDEIANVEIPLPRLDERHTEIYALADRGRTVPEIAAALGRPSGEIELILALRPRAVAST
jgi:DNA-binding NarL/FixJ family response regulator